jgi:tape measure domain-containing protein
MSADLKINISGTGFDAVSSQFQKLNADVTRISTRFSELNTALTSLVGALSLAGVAALTKSFIDAGLQTEKLGKLMNAAAGSASLGGREFEYVRQISEKMGLDMVGTAESYGKFMAAIRGTTLEGEAGRKVFESVSKATSALGLSADETKGIFNALQQMMSKGKVQAEELRGQLGERLPGAFKMAADAMGVSTAELDKMLKDGKVIADELLPKLAVQLELTYGKAASDGARSAAAEINRMNNAMFEAKGAMGSALMPVFTDIVRAITPALNKLKEFIGGLQIMAVHAAAIPDRVRDAWRMIKTGVDPTSDKGRKMYAEMTAPTTANINATIDDIMKRFMPTGSDYSTAELAKQQSNKRTKPLDEKKPKADHVFWAGGGFNNWRAEQFLLEEESKWLKNKNKADEDAARQAERTEAERLAELKRAAQEKRALAEESLNMRLAEVDAAEKLGEINRQTAVERKQQLYTEKLASQESFLGSIDVTKNPQAWLTASKAIQQTRLELNTLKRETRTFADDFAGGFADAWKNLHANAASTFQLGSELARSTAQAMQQAFSDGFFDLMAGKFNTLGQVFSSFLGTLQRALANFYAQMATNALIGKLAGFMTGSLAGEGNSFGVLQSDANAFTPPTFHSGGYVPRFHFGGLTADEVPAILQTGEGVLSRKGMAALAALNGGGGGGNVQVNIINQSGQQLQAEQQGAPRFDGEAWVVDVVMRRMRTSPAFRSAMAGGAI